MPPPLALPFARRDLDRLRLVLLAQRRLRESHRPASARRMVAAKSYFEEALRWLEIHGGEEGRELAAHWRSPGPAEPEGEPSSDDVAPEAAPSARGSAAAPPPPSSPSPAFGAVDPGRRAYPSGGRAMARLTEAEIAERLARLPGWERRGRRSAAVGVRRLRADRWLRQQVAELAEAADHHPDILIHYRRSPSPSPPTTPAG